MARYIIPFINEVFQPPLSIEGYSEDSDNIEPKNIISLPPSSVSGYQIITIPRKETDSENGRIFFIISDGIFSFDLWFELDETIDKKSKKYEYF